VNDHFKGFLNFKPDIKILLILRASNLSIPQFLLYYSFPIM